MSDIDYYLPKSRKLYREAMRSHYLEYQQEMKNVRVGPGTGYKHYYRDYEVIQHLRNIIHNLEETFGNVSIPEDFISPKLLVDAWKWFYDFLQSKEKDLFEDVFKTLNKEKESFSDPLRNVYSVHKNILALLNEILSMDEVKEYLKENCDSDVKKLQNSFDIAVITAIYDTEFVALKEMPITIDKYPVVGDSTSYWKGQIGNKLVLFATDDKMGLAAAASLSTKIIAKFSPNYIIMAGIAAGVKDNEKNYGDILVAKFTWNYESGKYKYNMKTNTSVFEPNPEQIELDASITHMINDLKTDESILQSIHDNFTITSENMQPNSKLKVFIGPFASGSAVLADEKKIDSIRKGNRKLIGIDMETFGVFYATKSFSNPNKTKAISIKSISDFADHRKNEKYRKYAAYTSVMFIYNLILKKLQ